MSEAPKQVEKPQDASEIKDLASEIKGEDAEQVKGGMIRRKPDAY
jgi:hypothetical protein